MTAHSALHTQPITTEPEEARKEEVAAVVGTLCPDHKAAYVLLGAVATKLSNRL